jgi:hypothetical protein
MKAIFINAKEQTVSIVENKGQLEDLYNTLGVNMVEIGRYYENGDTLWVDEEGLINGTDFGFTLDGIDYMGNGLIYGTNRMNPELNDSAVTDMKKITPEFFIFKFA